MINTINDDEIRSAVAEYVESIGNNEIEGYADHQFSEVHQMRMIHMLEQTTVKLRGGRVLKKFGAIAAVLILVIAVSVAVSPSIRAAISDYTSLLFGNTDLDRVYVAQFPENCLPACDIFRYGDSEHVGAACHKDIPIVIRVTPAEDIKDILHADEQEYIVKEVFRGEGINVGDIIKINRTLYMDAYDYNENKVNYTWKWQETNTDDPAIIEMHFSNLMLPEKDYLVFIAQESPLSKGNVKTYDCDSTLSVPYIYCYEDIENKTVAQAGDIGTSTYVKYSLVKDNEFFGMNEKVLRELEDLKKDILAEYPIGSGR